MSDSLPHTHTGLGSLHVESSRITHTADSARGRPRGALERFPNGGSRQLKLFQLRLQAKNARTRNKVQKAWHKVQFVCNGIYFVYKIHFVCIASSSLPTPLE